MTQFRINAVAALFGASLLILPARSQAASDPDLKTLRDEIAQMKHSYEQRIDALEARLAQAEAKAGDAQATAQQAVAQQSSPQPAPAPTQSNSYNPEIALILQGSYNNLSQKPNNYLITGFIPTNGGVGPGDRGFTIGESELAISSNIDPDWRGTLIASYTPEGGSSVENAYFQSIGLGHGLSFEGGRFFPGIGYLNEQHSHAWDFYDAPLAYKAFLGNQLTDDGVQMKWLAPTDTFLEFGAEAGRGLAFPGANDNKNGVSQGAVFAHLGDDVGFSSAWRVGLSYLASAPDNRSYDEVNSDGTTLTNSDGTAETNNFNGKSRLWIADGIWKWAPEGNGMVTNFKLQGEYFRRHEDGTLGSNALAGGCGGACVDVYDSDQSGWYLQGVYQFMPHWRAGLRHDQLDYGTQNIGLINSGTLTAADFPLLAAHDPERNTVMVDYTPSEFTRFRLQWARDSSAIGATDDQVFLQYIFSLGTHGAHQF